MRFCSTKDIQLIGKRSQRLHDVDCRGCLNFWRLAEQLRRLVVTTIDEFAEADEHDMAATLAQFTDSRKQITPSLP